jgi:uncharacterized protein YbjT (DUF2867 family)
MSAAPSPPRTALLAGATGLVGHALLERLLVDPACGRVTVLARKAPPDRHADPKLDWRQVDFSRLPVPFPAVDDVYIALGTTIRAAGSEAAFRRVDFDAVVDVARAAHAAGATRLGVVSALGADAGSRVFYNRVKGETEAALAALGYETLVIARPSLLTGDRTALGQPERRGERFALRLLSPVLKIVPAGMRPIAAAQVAAALHREVVAGRPGIRRLDSAGMQQEALA